MALSFKKHFFFLLVFGLCGCVLLSAQTAAEIEALLETPALSYAQIVRFVLKASEAAEITDSEEAFNFAAERNWLPKNATPDSQARLDGVSLLFMQSFGLKGGLFYSLFKNPHYAYRELVYQSVIQGKTFPQHTVSGDQLLFITGRILSIKENDHVAENEQITESE